MAIRDLFAKIGWCESTQQRAERPQLASQLINMAQRHARPVYKANSEHQSTYEARLKTVLETCSHAVLSKLVQDNVAIVLDKRLSKVKLGLRSREIFAALYKHEDQDIVCLFDNGKLESGFLERCTLDYAAKVLYITAFGNRAPDEPVFLGRLYYSQASKSTQFEWGNPDNFAYEFKRNPWFIEPPMVGADAASITPIATQPSQTLPNTTPKP